MNIASAELLMMSMPLAAVAALLLARQQQGLAALRREAERLRRTVLHLESLFEQAPLGMAVFDADLRIVRINRLLADADGVGVDDHIGKTVHDFVHDAADRIDAAFRKVLQTGQPIAGLVFEGTTVARPGDKRVWRLSIHPVFGSGGAMLGVSTAVEDITEQQQLADALRDSEQRERRRAAELESVMDTAPVAIFIAHDRDCRHVTANAAGRRQLRLDQGESPSITGPGIRAFDIYMDGEPVAPAQLPLQRAAATGEETVGREMTIAFPDGERMSVLVNAVPLRDEAGRLRGGVVAFVGAGGDAGRQAAARPLAGVDAG